MKKRIYITNFCVVNASSPKEACDAVESQISEWGTENNWRTIGGCVSEDNEVYSTYDKDKEWGNSRWCPEEGTTVEDINRQIRGWIKEDEYEKDLFIKCSEGKHKSPFDWYGAKKYCQNMFQIEMTKLRLEKEEREFDVLQDYYYEWELGECGVTPMDISQLDDDDPTNKKVYSLCGYAP